MRFSFGGDLAGWHIGYGDTATATDTGLTGRIAIALGGVNVSFWSAATGGTQYTDLQSATGVAITEVQTSAGTSEYPLGVLPRFSGPDNVPVMYAQPGAGPRLRITAVDAYNYLAGQTSGISSLQTQLTTLEGRVTTVEGQQSTVAGNLTTLTGQVTTFETWRRFPVAELRASIQTSLNASTWVTIAFGTEAFDSDQDDVGGHSTTTNTGRYTVRYTGLYLVAGSVTFNGVTGGSRYARWLINGATRPATHTYQAHHGAAPITVHANTMALWLLAGDYVELQGMQTSAGALATSTGEYAPHMTVVYLRSAPSGTPT